MIREIIILAGGLGTRLRGAIPDLPKCMAPIGGRPFLFYVINYFRSQGVEKFIFSLGYKHELIEDWLADQFITLDYKVIIEKEPLGTGGGILLASKNTAGKNVLIANGDTLFKINVSELTATHHNNNAECTLALKPMEDFDRYGIVEADDTGAITNFKEKQFYTSGLINGGVYALNIEHFLGHDLPGKFSFEKDYLENFYTRQRFYAVINDGYFIDIGIPEDYERAQNDLQPAKLDLNTIDSTWTLFIDRDGVINHEKKDEYILTWGEFRFYDGVKEAMKKFSTRFGKIIIISNQRGVGRQLMTEHDLLNIHNNLVAEIESSGGRIDNIYYCTSTDAKHPCRKPNPGMAFLAKKDLPSIDLSRAIMVGNKPSDMLFGRNAGIYTVFVRTTNPHQEVPHANIDLAFDSLADFAKAL